ncbi:hypothetical protein EO244_11035 [Ancylomarina salipaludis]|uniref:Uncharacterized protein n=1 Tax=Ancylomarina salipaludis TaxID=2501299 RepID=A0A4V1N008_9BACT|nr:hypothetical protein [Ancylomarina salipaludis]RXQ92998.1 hypothetical protein EO244_11035 [Ancylomarina salipaludis]
MKTKFIYINLLILIFIGSNHCLLGQPLSKGNIKTIINGRTWVPKTSIALGEQFFLERLDLKGSLLFKGTQFDNIIFAYDILTEEIITAIETSDKTKRNIIINPCFLEGFSVADTPYEFNFLRGDLLHPKLNPDNYYQFVKFPNLRYVIKRKKYKVLKSDQSGKFKYAVANSLFLIKNNELIPLSRKGDILKIFPHKKKEMKRFIRSNKLKIGAKTPMDAVVLLSKFDL